MSSRRKSNQSLSPDQVAKLNAMVAKDIPALMNGLFGKGQWFFDEKENLYIAANPKHSGPGFGFVAVRPDGSWFKGTRPSAVQVNDTD